MKRMFVPIRFRGLGIGRTLAARLLADSRTAGYRLMQLDTGMRQVEAIRLYEGLGFKRIAPYYALPKDLEDYLLFSSGRFEVVPMVHVNKLHALPRRRERTIHSRVKIARNRRSLEPLLLPMRYRDRG